MTSDYTKDKKIQITFNPQLSVAESKTILLREILYSNIPVKDKKELMSLVTALITKKYGHWNDNKIFQREPQKLPYLIRMKLIEFLIEPYDISKETEESLKEKVKHTAETIKKNAN